MKFGIFYELQLPRPWEEGDELRLYQNALTQLETADRLGYDHAWVVEHHFLEEYSHSPSPESFLAAASQRTKKIRLGHGIFQLTTNHPARVAERVAVLDLLSNGRCEFGMGESASITELTPFGRDMETKREVFEEAVAAIFPMFTKVGTEHHGKYFDIPLRNVVPKPVQKPHPPLWMACSQLQTIERAGENGFGALGFQFVSAEAAHAWVHAYYNAITKRLKKLADYEINPNMALVSFFMCAKTDEEARARADGATFFQFALRYYGASQNRQRPDPGTVNMWDEYNKWKRENPEAQEAALRGGLIGSPETIRKKLRRFRSSHIDQVILLNQAGKNSHEHICDSLELFAKEVMPEFQHDPEHEAWKAGVMSGAIQLEEIDTEAFKDRYGKLAVSVAPTPKVAAAG
ncbi:LLM class flavin-dependent oxidoreductase [Bradyrhizobium sp. AUGA SZCCT0177]|uniref:LLM class flavin-dependent oxidoreductase n=1 Tax=Bradyrhizobium sp. AUGA SZCCT0177 TaxID=2807665 RepID=UPI001BAD303F|nr:LLM class flavin-dependent oxidoreductase [Bradyrhizobium sp. AUGA SZCCT0177]MBR1281019.1 LLM class flavin-dependent oxidoreductase [Bradyrhizobium sp. AUGA SZCCT0177]